MDKLKRSLKHLFAPAIVLLLVAIMGVFSPVVSVVAALRVNPMADGLDGAAKEYTIENLPSRTVEVGTKIAVPTISTGSNGKVVLCHAGQKVQISGDEYTYQEIGQYEWRFYTNDILFDTHTVIVTDTTYSMTMPDNVATVAPKDLKTLTLPLPSTYSVGGKTVKIAEIKSVDHYATLKVEDSENEFDYVLKATVSLENNTFDAAKINISQNGLTIDLSEKAANTGNLNVTYYLYDQTGNKILAALPLSKIEFKNVTKDEVTFANIPTAPSVKNLAYYLNTNLTAPSADSAKAGSTSFSVEAQTVIAKVQCYLYSTEPSNWSNNSNVHNLIVEKDTTTGKWIIKENNQDTGNKYLEIDGLKVKIKKLGWYRFQFETSTLFGYQLDDDFNNDNVNVEIGKNHEYVRYWSDSVRIYRDSVEPNFAWVDPYSVYNEDHELTEAGEAIVADMNNNFDELLDKYTAYLPMTEKPESTDTKRITVNTNDGLVLPAIFPHDNATSFANMKVTAFAVDQIQDENGKTISGENYVWSDKTTSKNAFIYDQTKCVQIQFVESDAERLNTNNTIQLLARKGLYRVRVVVEEEQPKFEDEDKYYTNGYANTKTKYLYFYVDDRFESNDANHAPVIDENQVFQVSDVYLWEGSTFDFVKPTYSDNYTPTDDIETDYYLVGKTSTAVKVLSKLEVNPNATRVTVDLKNLYMYENGAVTTNKLDFDSIKSNYDSYYIYAVARNFNAMQANLKVLMGIKEADEPGVIDDETYFHADLFTKLNSTNSVKQYGYAWKRAEFVIHDTATSTKPTFSVQFDDTNNSYTAGKTVHIDQITATWSNKVDGQLSAAVYLVKSNNVLVPVDLKNGDAAGADIISSVSFNRNKFEVKDWYFTPGVGGNYILVLTAKDHADSKVYSYIQSINISSSGDWEWGDLNTTADTNYTIDSTMSLGESLTLPSRNLSRDNKPVYFAKNRNLYKYNENGEVTEELAGDYTITVLNKNDTNCITGNKFVPNQSGLYILQFSFKLDGSDEPLLVKNYNVQVNNDATGVSSIRMNEAYDDEPVLWNVEHEAAGETVPEDKYQVNGQVYQLSSEFNINKPAYAIVLNQFTMANYGAQTDFVVDSKFLYQYLEPVYENGKITAYMYPAIAIPMPNVVADTVSSDEVEITVQKSGSSNYLVSNKKLNAGGSSNKESEIEKIAGYYVFRPDGKFKPECKTEGNEKTYLQDAYSLSAAAGVYTVSYKTSTTSINFNITLGNLENGTLAWKQGFLTYDNDDGKGTQEITKSDSTDKVVIEEINGHRYVTIDMSKIYFEGNDDMEDLIAEGPNQGDSTGYNPSKLAEEYYWQNVSVWVTFDDASFISYNDWSDSEDETEAIKIYSNGEKYLYKFDLNRGSGTYKVHISMPNKYTSSTVSETIEFTIDVDVTNKNHNLNNVWGIILIVLSLGLLAGVVYYFIRTARVTRFVDVPRAAKGKTKTQKAVEAPKEDAK